VCYSDWAQMYAWPAQESNTLPFDGLTPLRGEWDNYFLLRVCSIGRKPR
jgi:hypothetical protein